LQDTPKIYPNLDFRFEIKPFGNHEEKWLQRFLKEKLLIFFISAVNSQNFHAHFQVMFAKQTLEYIRPKFILPIFFFLHF
jgi:hypothetical protein